MIASNERLLARLRSLAGAGVPFVTIGSAGPALAHPIVRKGYELPDADVLLAEGALPGFVRWAEGAGGAVTCWGEPWRWTWGERELAGKLYVRARWVDEQVDATYEEARLDAGAWVRDARWVDGVPVCAERELWAGKLRKDELAARAFAAAWGLTIAG